MSGKPPISTHILDTTRGQPAVGVDVKNKLQFYCVVLFGNSKKNVDIYCI